MCVGCEISVLPGRTLATGTSFAEGIRAGKHQRAAESSMANFLRSVIPFLQRPLCFHEEIRKDQCFFKTLLMITFVIISFKLPEWAIHRLKMMYLFIQM